MKIVTDPDMQGTSAPFRWYLSKEELNRLAETGKKVYLLLLVVSNKGHLNETRYLIPVGQMMEYVNFYTPGEHKIFATVVWQKGGYQNLREFFLRKHKDIDLYMSDLYDYYDGELDKRYFDICDFGIYSFEVNVPKEVFAKEPPAWEKWWVNFFQESNAKDQCRYRRRRLFAYSVQPPFALMLLLVLEFATSLIIGGLLLFGTKGIGFRKIIHPLAEPFCSIWDETRGSIFGRRFVSRLLPSIFLGSSVISGVTYQLIGFQPDLLIKAIMTGGIAVGAVVAAPYFVVLSYLGAAKIINKIKDILIPGAEERRKQKILLAEAAKKEKTRKLRQKIEDEYALLACDGNGNLPVNIKNLPLAKRTIHLRYEGLKAGICKSFAR